MNWKEPYSWTCRYVKRRIIITLVMVTHLYIQVAGLWPLKSSCNAPIGRKALAYTSSVKKEGPAAPSSTYD